jgi:sRNA-binding carbon storage regulator CsrA
VHRKEVYEAIKRENQQAAQLRPADIPDVAQERVPPEQPGLEGSLQ